MTTPTAPVDVSVAARAAASAAGMQVAVGSDPVADKLQALHDTLTAAVADLADGQAWQQMLRTAAKFHHYSPHNVLLITAQCPHAQAVAGYQTWKQLDRQVRKGERGIAILAPVVRRGLRANDRGPAPDPVLPTVTPAGAPGTTEEGSRTGEAVRRLAGFRVVHVFDISQTDGPDLPTPPRPDLLDGAAPPGLLEGLARQVTDAGFTLTTRDSVADFTALHPGLAEANGVTDFLARTVQLRPGLSDAQSCKTLAHELGHVLLHEPAQRPANVTREIGEVEAESVAFIVAAAHGLDTSRYTVPYVAGWAAGDVTALRATAERVLSTARRVLAESPPEPLFTLPTSLRAPSLTREPTPAPAPARELTLVCDLEPGTRDLTPPTDAPPDVNVPEPPGQGGLW